LSVSIPSISEPSHMATLEVYPQITQISQIEEIKIWVIYEICGSSPFCCIKTSL